MIETLKVQNSLGIQSAINYKINHPEIINNEQEVEETKENAYNPAIDVEKLKKRIATPIKQNSET